MAAGRHNTPWVPWGRVVDAFEGSGLVVGGWRTRLTTSWDMVVEPSLGYAIYSLLKSINV